MNYSHRHIINWKMFNYSWNIHELKVQLPMAAYYFAVCVYHKSLSIYMTHPDESLENIEEFRHNERVRLTKENRPDLLGENYE